MSQPISQAIKQDFRQVSILSLSIMPNATCEFKRQMPNYERPGQTRSYSWTLCAAQLCELLKQWTTLGNVWMCQRSNSFNKHNVSSTYKFQIH